MAPSRRTHLTQEDVAEWARYAKMVTPLPGRAAPEPPPEPPAFTRGEVAPASTVPKNGTVLTRPAPAAPVVIGLQPPGVDRATWTRLRTGKLGVARGLDLHGLRVQPAYDQLIRFVLAAHADRVQCVEIVTGLGSGEGTGVIRREFPLWINMAPLRPLILAAAYPHMANQGAVRLLLRRARDPAAFPRR